MKPRKPEKLRAHLTSVTQQEKRSETQADPHGVCFEVFLLIYQTAKEYILLLETHSGPFLPPGNLTDIYAGSTVEI